MWFHKEENSESELTALTRLHKHALPFSLHFKCMSVRKPEKKGNLIICQQEDKKIIFQCVVKKKKNTSSIKAGTYCEL